MVVTACRARIKSRSYGRVSETECELKLWARMRKEHERSADGNENLLVHHLAHHGRPRQLHPRLGSDCSANIVVRCEWKISVKCEHR